MKKITFAFLLMANILWAQDAEKVWDLLLQNKREEARNQFDKEFAKSKESDIDLLILDAIIDTQNGRIEFDKSFLEKFSKLPPATNLNFSNFPPPNPDQNYGAGRTDVKSLLNFIVIINHYLIKHQYSK